jgi:protein-S-isoprenylcysteine O-methyltransferase Ste14
MYLAVLAIILGQALVLWRGVLVGYAAAFFGVVAAFVAAYEEPTLLRRHGAEYDAYRGQVRGWIPRLRPWRGADPPSL